MLKTLAERRNQENTTTSFGQTSLELFFPILYEGETLPITTHTFFMYFFTRGSALIIPLTSNGNSSRLFFMCLSQPLFLYFRLLYIIALTDSYFRMLGFTTQISGAGSNCSANCATTTALFFISNFTKHYFSTNRT